MASGTVYTGERLGAQAADVLTSAEEAGEETGTKVREGLPDGAQECVLDFEEANGVRVTLVDDALFETGGGTERAWVLFTQDTDGQGAVVLDPRHCAGGGDTGGGVLAETSL